MNRLAPFRFVVWFGVVALLGDFVYEGARSVVGPYLATLGASATVVGLVTGLGEAVALALRPLTGRLADRTQRLWPITIVGYAITMVSVPLLAVFTSLVPASTLVVSERFGKAVRSPAKDTMLAAAGSKARGFSFAVHEALDQTGALVGPLLVALCVYLSGYRLGFAVLAAPGALALVVLMRLRRLAPEPEQYDAEVVEARRQAKAGVKDVERLPRRFWLYALFTALTMLGFATLAVLAYHLQARHVLRPALIPVLYAAAMAASGVGALVSGFLYDRLSLRVLALTPFLAAVVPFLSFQRNWLVWLGAIVWGLTNGMHESTMKAAVADLAPRIKRGASYGTFALVYGLAWLAGSTSIGFLYGRSLHELKIFVVVVELVAFVAFLPLLRRRVPATTA